MMTMMQRGQEIIRAAATHPDPVGAMKALEAEAQSSDRLTMLMLWEGLRLALSYARLSDAPNDHD